jgi:WD40 repeat protein
MPLLHRAPIHAILSLAIAACGRPVPAATPREPAPALVAPPERPPLVGDADVFLEGQDSGGGIGFVWSKSGALIAMEQEGQTIGVFETATGKLRARIHATEHVLALGFRKDDSGLWAILPRGAIAWDLATGQQTLAVRAQSVAWRRAAFSSSGELLAVLDRSGKLSLRDGNTGAERWSATISPDAVLSTWASSSDVFTTLVDGRTTRWDAASGSARDVPPSPAGVRRFDAPDFRSAVLVFDDGNRFRFVSGPNDTVLAQHKLQGKVAYLGATGRGIPLVNGDRARVDNVLFSPDGKVAAVSYDPPNSVYGLLRSLRVALYDLQTGKRIAELPGDVFNLLGFSDDGKTLLVEPANTNRTIAAWDASTGKSLGLRPKSMHSGYHEFGHFAAGRDRGMVNVIIDVETGSTVFTAEEAAFSRSERSLVAFDPKTLRFALGRGDPNEPMPPVFASWEPASDKFLSRASDPVRLKGVTLLDDGGLLTFEKVGNVESVVARDKSLAPRYSMESKALPVVVSGEDRMLVSGATRAEIRRISDQEIIKRFDAPFPRWIPPSPEGTLAYFGWKSAVHTVDPKTLAELVSIPVETKDARFRGDGRLLVLTVDNYLHVYDPKTGILESKVPFHSGITTTLTWSPNALFVQDDGNGSNVSALIDTRTGRVIASVPRATGVFTPDSSRFILQKGEVLEIRRSADGALLRRQLLPDLGEVVGVSADGSYAALALRSGCALVRLADGALLRTLVAVNGGVASHVVALGSGHFDGPARGAVRIWTDVGLFASGPERDAFVRERPALDFFGRQQSNE